MIPAVCAQSAPARNQSFAPAVIRAACWGYCVALSAALENDLVSWFWTSLFTWSALGLSSRAYRGVEFSDIAQGSIAAGPGTRVGHLGGRGRLYDHESASMSPHGVSSLRCLTTALDLGQVRVSHHPPDGAGPPTLDPGPGPGA
jgi:hypothetical protein